MSARYRKFEASPGDRLSTSMVDSGEFGEPLILVHPTIRRIAILHFLSLLDPSDVYSITEQIEENQTRATYIYYRERNERQNIS